MVSYFSGERLRVRIYQNYFANELKHFGTLIFFSIPRDSVMNEDNEMVEKWD